MQVSGVGMSHLDREHDFVPGAAALIALPCWSMVTDTRGAALFMIVLRFRIEE